MPVTSASQYVASLLVGMTPPGATGINGPITALITPLDPDVEADGVARVYVWPSHGPETRLAMPRNSGMGTPAGWKQIAHDLDVFLVWQTPGPDDPDEDTNFPLFIDWVMDILRTSQNEAQWLDPETGLISHFENLGEDMTYDYVPPRSLELQGASRRYDARIQCHLMELFQR